MRANRPLELVLAIGAIDKDLLELEEIQHPIRPDIRAYQDVRRAGAELFMDDGAQADLHRADQRLDEGRSFPPGLLGSGADVDGGNNIGAAIDEIEWQGIDEAAVDQEALVDLDRAHQRWQGGAGCEGRQQRQGNVADSEMHRVFNCGIGMAVIVAPEYIDTATQLLQSMGEIGRRIGTIREQCADESRTIIE